MDVVRIFGTFSFATIQVIAIIFGIIWVVVNLYTYIPIAQFGIDRLATRVGKTSNVDTVAPADVPVEEWPSVDVFITAYDEADVIEQAIRSTVESAYPAEKLQVTVLTEPGDEETNSVVSALTERYQFVHRIVPADYPGTPNKPRALNYGFEFSDAAVVGVIDAEDLVDETFVQNAAVEIAHGQSDFVHGVLDMVNEGDGWVNLLFRAEYGYWFRLVVPGFISTGFDVPLPGTTCFFDRAVLEDIATHRAEVLGEAWTSEEKARVTDGGLSGLKPWDPRNVTEDFEIGLLLCARGYTPGFISIPTDEESPIELNDWIRQRTRWQKGKLYTFLQYRDNPPAGLSHKFHFFYQSLLPHLGPINITALVVIFILSRLLAYRPLPLVRIVLSIGLAFTLVAMVITVLGYWLASEQPFRTRLRRAIIVSVGVFPYWVLQWGADIRAIYQTYAGRFNWEHTTHLGRNLSETLDDPRTTTNYEMTRTMNGLTRQALLTGILLTGFALRVVDITAQSLWTDEIYSVAVRGSMALPELLVMPQDPHPPLYYALLRTWIQVFGTTPMAVRSFSILCSMGAIYVGYLVAARLFDDRTGLVVAALLAVSVFHVHFGRMARMYSLFVLVSLVSWYGLLDVRTGSTLQRAGYAVATAAVLYTHAFGVFVVAAQWFYLAVTTPESGTRRPEKEAIAGVSLLGIPLVYLLGRVVYQTVTQTGPSLDWIPAPSLDLLSKLGLLYAGYPDIYPILAGSTTAQLLATLVGTLFIAGFGLSLFTYSSEEGFELAPARPNGQMAALAVIPTLGPLLISILYRPVLVPRYTIPATFGVFAIAANGLTNIPIRTGRLVAVLLVVGSLFAMSGVYATGDTFEDWRGAAETIEAESVGGQAVIYQPGWTRTDVRYYASIPGLIEYRLKPDGESLRPQTQERLETIRRQHQTIWYVQYSAQYDAPTSRWLRSNAQQQSVREFGIVTLYRFAVNDSTASTDQRERNSVESRGTSRRCPARCTSSG